MVHVNPFGIIKTEALQMQIISYLSLNYFIFSFISTTNILAIISNIGLKSSLTILHSTPQVVVKKKFDI